MAERNGVRELLEQRWGEELTGEIHRQVGEAAQKAWRFDGELHEIADTMAAAGMPDGFHRAGAEIYRRLAPFQHAEGAPTIEELLLPLAGL